MPVVSKQTVNSKPKAQPIRKGVLSQAIDVSELVNTWLKVCIYGENRVGKTLLACQFPKPLLLLGFEPNETGGALTVRKTPGIKYLRMKTSEPVAELCHELSEGAVCDLDDDRYNGKPYASVVVDSATSLQDVILQEILGLDSVIELNSFGRVSRDQYFERSDKTRERLRLLLNLKMHTIITAKQKDHNRKPDDKTPKMLGGLELQSFFGASLGAETAGWLHDACDYLCRLFVGEETKKIKHTVGKPGTPGYHEEWEEVPTGKMIRRLQTMYHPNYAGGFRSDTPEAVPEFIENPTYDRIAAVIRGEKLK